MCRFSAVIADTFAIPRCISIFCYILLYFVIFCYILLYFFYILAQLRGLQPCFRLKRIEEIFGWTMSFWGICKYLLLRCHLPCSFHKSVKFHICGDPADWLSWSAMFWVRASTHPWSASSLQIFFLFPWIRPKISWDHNQSHIMPLTAV